MTRPRHEFERALALHALGANTCAISRTLGIPRTTVRDWIEPRYIRTTPVDSRMCFRCAGNGLEPGVDYVYLLGLYLGDGCISGNAKGVWRLRIFQDMRYPQLINECELAMAIVTPTRVSITRRIGCVEIGASWKHWVHIIPQQGPGMKYLLRIELEPWQQALVDQYPAQLVRGLIHSDGCRSLNTVRRRRRHGDAWYSYPRYQFTNTSDDIRLIFTNACDRLGIHWTRMNALNVAISRKRDVDCLDSFIGPKY